MYVDANANPTILNCLLEDNEAGAGGGIAVSQSEGRIDDSVIQNCVATAVGGGGISISFSPSDEAGYFATRVNNTQIVGNRHVPNAFAFAVSGGGGILLFDRAAAVFRGCTVSENTAEDTPGGGAMEDGTSHIFRVINCVFDANESTYSSGTGGRGGAMYIVKAADPPITKIINCQFSNNHCGGSGDSNPLHGGGGVYSFRATGYVVNSLFRDNMARNGAGMLSDGSLIRVENCTLSQNAAGNLGGGVYASKSTGTVFSVALPTVTNSIIWDNTSTNGTNEQKQFWTDRVSTNPVVLTYSCLQSKVTSGVLDAGTNTASDPLFRNPTTNDFHLTKCSPVIDRANTLATEQDEENADLDTNTTCTGAGSGCHPGERTPDLDIGNRVVQYAFASVGGGVAETECVNGCTKIVDMGCFEFQGACDPSVCPILGDLNGDGHFNGLDIDPFVKCMIGTTSGCACPCADMNQNGSLQVIPDVGLFVQALITKHEIVPCTGGGGLLVDCNDNGELDNIDVFSGTSADCNHNFLPDECDIAAETSTDVDSDGVPDECQTDCDSDTIPDAWAIAQSLVADINSNGVPDACEPDCDADGEPDDYEIANGAADCNTNGIPDTCEYDCNANGVPDDCDINPNDPDGNTFVSEDCNENGIPDECDLSRSILPSFDCNGNDVPDECDIANATSQDANSNHVPDECEQSLLDGGSQNSMAGGGEGVEFDADAAWAEFFAWFDDQVSGDPGDWHTLTGPEKFERVMDELQVLGLPIAPPW